MSAGGARLVDLTKQVRDRWKKEKFQPSNLNSLNCGLGCTVPVPADRWLTADQRGRKSNIELYWMICDTDGSPSPAKAKAVSAHKCPTLWYLALARPGGPAGMMRQTFDCFSVFCFSALQHVEVVVLRTYVMYV